MVDAIREEYCSDQRPFQAEATFSTASVGFDSLRTTNVELGGDDATAQ
ncbi:hypothetical protein [Sphingomonas sp. Ant20]|nr:hypothetical protein [Sphingomonas sp. Ant20]